MAARRSEVDGRGRRTRRGGEEESREARVLSLLRDMEEILGREERSVEHYRKAGGNHMEPNHSRRQREIKANSIIAKRKESKAAVSAKEKSSAGDGPEREPSETSIGVSRVQQLRLFWDKFFLTETAPERSSDLLDKARFISEARTEMLDERKKKPTKKISIPPSRLPISFRLVPSKQNKRKKVQDEERFSDMGLVLSREVSTCVAKVALTPSQVTLSANTSHTSISATSSKHKSTTPDSEEIPEEMDNQYFKDRLYRMLLAEEVSRREPQERPVLKGCTRTIGFRLRINVQRLLHSYREGVAINTEEAFFMEPSMVKVKSSGETRARLRKHCTLLPCYYFTVQEPTAPPLAGGDSLIRHDPLDKPLDKKSYGDACSAFAYERVTFCTCSRSASGTQTLKVSLSADEPSSSSLVLTLACFLAFIGLAIFFYFFIRFNIFSNWLP